MKVKIWKWDIHIHLVLAWCDLWVGAYWDRKKHCLYILPLPMFGMSIKFIKRETQPTYIRLSLRYTGHVQAETFEKTEEAFSEVIKSIEPVLQAFGANICSDTIAILSQTIDVLVPSRFASVLTNELSQHYGFSETHRFSGRVRVF